MAHALALAVARCRLTVYAVALGGLLVLAATPDVVISPAQAQAPMAPIASTAGYCRSVWVTGYVRSEFSARTYDGTSIYTDEPIAAASVDIPIGQHVVIQDVGRFRVADRGHLGSDGWVDVAVWTRSEAFALTGRRHACIVAPDDPDPFDEARTDTRTEEPGA